MIVFIHYKLKPSILIASVKIKDCRHAGLNSIKFQQRIIGANNNIQIMLIEHYIVVSVLACGTPVFS